MEKFGRPVASDFIDSGYIHVFAAKHEVARHTYGIKHFLLVLMTGRNYSVCSRPVVCGFHETLGVKARTESEKIVSGSCCIRAYVIPECRIEPFGRESVCLCKTLIEIICPYAALRTV